MSGATFFRLLLQANARILRRRVTALREQSWLMVGVIGLFVVGYWIAGYVLFRLGFRFLAQEVPGVGGMLLDRLLYLFFAVLFLMLLFSNIVIGYSGLFKNQETQWLLTLPVRTSDVFQWKQAETTVLASWAFVFLLGPLLLAYGTVRQVPAWFYLKTVLLFVPFIVIPGALGSLVVLVLTRYLHRRVFKWVLCALGAVSVIGVAFVFKPLQAADLQQAQMVASVNQLLHHSRASLQPLLPSYWVASALVAWGQGAAGKGMFFFLVLISNALMGTLVCVTASVRWFYESWSRNHSQGTLRLGVALLDKRIGVPRAAWLERVFDCLPLHPGTRAMMVKDARVFWRDTAQWSQFIIFFGLFGLYVLNLRRGVGDWSSPAWISFIALLNLGAASMTLATLTTRFAFPQFSLEGKRLWLVGLAPYGLKRVLLEKFWLSSSVAVVVTLSLTMLSNAMLHVPAWLGVLLDATVVLMSFALCGIAIGVGALFPNFGSGATAHRQEDNPAKIVSGFGGTFCFMLSLVYIIVVIGAEAVPLLVRGAGGADGDERLLVMVGVWLGVALASFLASVVPMSLALKRVETLEA